MTDLPAWNRAEEADRLFRYVQVGRAATFLPGLPGRDATGTTDALERCRILYNEFAGRRIVYDDEPLPPATGWQVIRGPATVLGPPFRANCIDLAVAFAGACLDTGLHPLISVLDTTSGVEGHALVLVCLGALWTRVGGSQTYRRFQPDTSVPPTDWPGGLCTGAGDPGAFLPLDIALVARHGGDDIPVSFEEAVEAGYALLTSPAWQITNTVDVGLRFHPSASYHDRDVDTAGIRTHAEEMHSLSGPRKNLLPENVEFVPPEDESAPSHPANILRRLEHGEGRVGVVLVAAAGMGKTRTCYEVASAASDCGWQVLHVDHEGESAVSTDLLTTVLRNEATENVLIVLDDINECHDIQISLIHSRLVPELHERNIRLRVLASCRSGALASADLGIQHLLEVVTLDPSLQQRTRVRDHLILSLAPNAVEILGFEVMRRVCGIRPVLAMLIAVEAEHLAAEGALRPDVGSIRSGDLVSWLSRRLQEDGVIPLPPDNIVLADQSADPRLKLCAAEFAATPQIEADILDAGRRLTGAPEDAAESVLYGLRRSGWMIQGHVLGGTRTLVPAHDLVVDEVLKAVLFEASGRLADTTVVQLLDAGLGRGRTLARYAVNLTRVYQDLEDEYQKAALATVCANWLSAHAEEVGRLLAGAHSEGAAALGSILNNPMWTATVEENWRAVAAPWLEVYGRSYSAMNLFGGGAAVAGIVGGRSEADRIAWIGQNAASPLAAFALIPLLAGGDAETAAEVQRCALAWLDHNPDDPAAVFVLRELVSGGAAGNLLPKSVIDQAVDWLRLKGAVFEAIYVLAPLLHGRHEQNLLERLTPALPLWLDRYQTHQEAHHILGPLLDIPSGSFPYDITAMATRWIELHGVGSDRISKHLCRKAVTEVLAAQILEWVIDHPGSDDVWWRLARIVKGANRWPHLMDQILTAVETAMWVLSTKPTRYSSHLNAHGEVDGTLQSLTKKAVIGINAARLDDILHNWVIRPEAFAVNCSPGTYYPELVRRVSSLCIAGRFDQATAYDVLTRMQAWIARWDCEELHENRRLYASEYVEFVLRLFPQPGRGNGSSPTTMDETEMQCS
jgi:hypothetical protein